MGWCSFCQHINFNEIIVNAVYRVNSGKCCLYGGYVKGIRYMIHRKECSGESDCFIYFFIRGWHIQHVYTNTVFHFTSEFTEQCFSAYDMKRLVE